MLFTVEPAAHVKRVFDMFFRAVIERFTLDTNMAEGGGDDAAGARRRSALAVFSFDRHHHGCAFLGGRDGGHGGGEAAADHEHIASEGFDLVHGRLTFNQDSRS